MRKSLVLALAMFSTTFLPLLGSADVPAPKPRSGGDYWVRSEHTWLDWEVTTQELAGRLTPQWPSDCQEPGALLHLDWQVSRWPLVRKFTKGDRLKALPDPVGNILIKDIDGSSWLHVSLEEGGQCFVRANVKFVRPIRVQRAGEEGPTRDPSPSPKSAPDPTGDSGVRP